MTLDFNPDDERIDFGENYSIGYDSANDELYFEHLPSGDTVSVRRATLNAGEVENGVVNAGQFDTVKAAINYAEQNGYGKVFVPPGTHTFSGHLENLSVDIEGTSQSILEADNIGMDIAAENVVIENISIRAGTASDADAAGIRIESPNVTLRDVRLLQAANDGIYIRANRHYITGCYFQNCNGNAVQFDYGSGVNGVITDSQVNGENMSGGLYGANDTAGGIMTDTFTIYNNS